MRGKGKSGMKRAAITIIVILGIAALVFTVVGGMRQSSRQRSNFSVSDIKGDSLGMSLEQYERKHPESHCGPDDPACDLRSATYAGVPLNKSAAFTDSRLYNITYFGHAAFADDQVLGALKEKYGATPQCVKVEDNRSCEWWNGSARVKFFSGPTGMSVSFTLDELAQSVAAKTEERQAHDRKTDQ
jgi:hypothetical protein